MPRKPGYLQAETVSHNRWLISYTDIVTILLILFVAVAAQSQNHLIQAAATAAPPRHSHPALPPAAQELQQLGLDLRREPRGLVISLPQAILFASGDDGVNPSALPTVALIANVLGGMNNKVILVGHADTVPIHNQRFRSNWELSAARSLSLLSLLVTHYGIDESRLSVQSYGSYNPKTSNDTEGGRAENRRVEILILDELPQDVNPR